MDAGQNLIMSTCEMCNSTIKDPRLLGCFHSFCKQCLTQLSVPTNSSSVEITCMKCDKVTSVGSVDDLIVDELKTRLLDDADIKGGSMKCTCCRTNDNAVKYCMQCRCFLCLKCVDVHKELTVFNEHKKKSMRQVLADGGSVRPLYCKMHRFEHLDFFCMTCSTLVCSYCMRADHRLGDHACVSAWDENISKQEIDKISRAVTKLTHLTTRTGQGDTDALKQKYEEAMTKLTEAATNFRRIFDKYIKKVTEELKNATLTRVGELNKARTDAEQAATNLNRHIQGASSRHILACKEFAISHLADVRKTFEQFTKTEGSSDGCIVIDKTKFEAGLQASIVVKIPGQSAKRISSAQLDQNKSLPSKRPKQGNVVASKSGASGVAQQGVAGGSGTQVGNTAAAASSSASAATTRPVTKSNEK